MVGVECVNDVYNTILDRSWTVLNVSISSLPWSQSVHVKLRSGKFAISKQSKPVRNQFKPVLNSFYLVPNTSKPVLLVRNTFLVGPKYGNSVRSTSIAF